MKEAETLFKIGLYRLIEKRLKHKSKPLLDDEMMYIDLEILITDLPVFGSPMNRFTLTQSMSNSFIDLKFLIDSLVII